MYTIGLGQYSRASYDIKKKNQYISDKISVESSCPSVWLTAYYSSLYVNSRIESAFSMNCPKFSNAALNTMR